MLAWLSVWGEMQICIWPSRCHCHSLSLASVNPDWLYLLVLPFCYQKNRKTIVCLCVCVCMCLRVCMCACVHVVSLLSIDWDLILFVYRQYCCVVQEAVLVLFVSVYLCVCLGSRVVWSCMTGWKWLHIKWMSSQPAMTTMTCLLLKDFEFSLWLTQLKGPPSLQ